MSIQQPIGRHVLEKRRGKPFSTRCDDGVDL